MTARGRAREERAEPFLVLRRPVAEVCYRATSTSPCADSSSADADVALVIAFITRLRRVFAAPSSRPLLPTVAMDVCHLSLRSDVGVDQFVEVLEKGLRAGSMSPAGGRVRGLRRLARWRHLAQGRGCPPVSAKPSCTYLASSPASSAR